MVESRLAALTRALHEVRGRRGLVQLIGGLALGHALAPELTATDAEAAERKQRKREQKRALRQERRQRKRGRTGPRGPSGQDGTQGPAGANGQDGSQGPTGDPGPPGAAGATGATGAQGPAGIGSCPDGKVFVGAVGCVDEQVRGRGSFFTASSTCIGSERLLTSAELLALYYGMTVNLDPRGEWSGTVNSSFEAIVVGGIELNPVNPEPQSRSFAIRCMSVPSIVTS
jgi:hypothetical protein